MAKAGPEGDEGRAPGEGRRAVFLIPNLFTALALLAGFYAVVKAYEGEIEVACWSIVLAAILDMLDGRVARLINAQSEFGAQFDSLSDVICFGIAPAVVAHQWGLVELGRIGFVAGFFYTASAAVRLARFNVSHGAQSPRFFRGLPSPMAGVTVATAVLVAGAEPTLGLVTLMMLLIVAVAATMVSDFLYYSFKDIDLRARVNTPAKILGTLLLVSLVAFIILELREAGLFLLCLAYLLSGIYLSGRHLVRRMSAGGVRREMVSWVRAARERFGGGGRDGKG